MASCMSRLELCPTLVSTHQRGSRNRFHYIAGRDFEVEFGPEAPTTSSCAKNPPRPDCSTIGAFAAIAGGLRSGNSAQPPTTPVPTSDIDRFAAIVGKGVDIPVE
jgi:hypothetical protein